MPARSASRAVTCGVHSTVGATMPVAPPVVYVAGKMQTRKWRKDGEDSDRFSTEILLVPGSRIQFLDKPAGANGNSAQVSGEAAEAAAGTGETDSGEALPF